MNRSFRPSFGKSSCGRSQVLKQSLLCLSKFDRIHESECHACEEILDPAILHLCNCSTWSCSFLLSPRFAVFHAAGISCCLYCDMVWVDDVGNDERKQKRHMVDQHQYRSCEQEVFFTKDALRSHLVDDHHAQT